MRQVSAQFWAKRSVDCVVAASVLAASAPVLAVASLAIAQSMGRPILFRQRRPGRHGAPFEILKLRTMAEPGPAAQSDGERLTALGRLLRATSVDEIPQLLNVLRGEMSLVGPRPLLMEYLPLYTREQARRHDVLPGMTGWAQVNGRNALSHEERFALDVWYVDNWSLALDFKILAMTFLRLFARRGISSQGHATMPKFEGAADRRAA
jgi:lipopolysaccharide/colanic/teichoic acid biosynthesis glycosyltransferase